MQKQNSYLKEADVEKITKISLPSLRLARSQNTGIPYIKLNKSVFYNYTDVIHYMESRKIQTDSNTFQEVRNETE